MNQIGGVMANSIEEPERVSRRKGKAIEQAEEAEKTKEKTRTKIEVE